MKIELKRLNQSHSIPTFGVLLNQGVPFAVTLELPWRGNKRRVSCIPDGRYECKRVNSPKFGNTFQVKDVEGRSHILFHKGNRAKNSLGCILVGESYDHLYGDLAILSSKKGYGEFMEILEDHDSFDLTISWCL